MKKNEKNTGKKQNSLMAEVVLCVGVLAFVLIGGLLTTSILNTGRGGDSSTGWIEVLNEDLTKGPSEKFEFADGYSNGSMFDCTWQKENGTFDENGMTLSITKDSSGEGKYFGAEYRSKDFYGYGGYEVKMKPIKNEGVVSSFFIYTGESDGNQWDEIDIEFLGKDTTKVQFNYFTAGEGNHEFIYSLGFDASEEFHSYGFEWKEGMIQWFVDGEVVHTVTKNIPVTPGKIMMNVWPGTGVDDWLAPYDGTTDISAQYQYIKYWEEEK